MESASPQTRFLDYDKSLACIHCGLCLSSCPTYLETGNENDSPRGRIFLMKEVAEGRAGVDANLAGHLYRCLGCRACETACPSGVPFGKLLERGAGAGIAGKHDDAVGGFEAVRI